jgi:hypothetical protein
VLEAVQQSLASKTDLVALEQRFENHLADLSDMHAHDPKFTFMTRIKELDQWSSTCQTFIRDWQSTVESDLNYLWDQVKYLKDDTHPGWREVTGYQDLPSDAARITLAKRMINEQPVRHAPSSIRNYGSPNEPSVPFNDSTAYIPPAPIQTRVSGILAEAALASAVQRPAMATIQVATDTEQALTPSSATPRNLAFQEAMQRASPKRPLSPAERLAHNTPLPIEAGPSSSTGYGSATNNAGTSNEASPTLPLLPEGAEIQRRGSKSPRLLIVRNEQLADNDNQPIRVALLASDLAPRSPSAWGAPDFDNMTPLQCSASPRLDHFLVCSTEEFSRLAEQAGKVPTSPSSDRTFDVGQSDSDSGSVPEDRLYSATQQAALSAMLGDGADTSTISDKELVNTRSPEWKWVPRGDSPRAYFAEGNEPESTTVPAVRTAVPSKSVSEEPSSDETPSSEGDRSQPAPTAAHKASRKTRRNQMAKQRRKQREEAMSRVPKLLAPRAPNRVIERMGADYEMTPEEKDSHSRFFGREAISIMLNQEHGPAALHLLSADQNDHIKPARVMIDNGADLTLLISPTIARKLRVKWTPGSANLFGIGGPSEGHSHADKGQQVVLRLGNFTGSRAVGPWDGCHIVGYRPIIMSESTAAEIGCDVILGQKAMRTCLATVDPFRETLDFSPAWFLHGCADFRCSINVVMTRPIRKQNTVVNLLRPLFRSVVQDDAESFQEQVVLPAVPATRGPSSSVEAVAGSSQAAPKPHKKGPVSFEKHPKALEKQARTPEAVRAAAASPHPGFPQTPEVPSREQMADVRKQRERRNRHNKVEAERRAAEARIRAADKLSNVIAPATIGYSVKDLQASGRLMSDYKLDLSGGPAVSGAQLETLVDAILPRLIDMLKAQQSAPNGQSKTRHGRPSSSTSSSSSDSSARAGSSPTRSSSGYSAEEQPQAVAPKPVPAPRTVAPTPAPVTKPDLPTPAIVAPVPETAQTAAAADPAVRRNPPRAGRPQAPAVATVMPAIRGPYGVSDDWLRQSGFAAPAITAQQNKTPKAQNRKFKGKVVQSFGLTVPSRAAVKTAVAALIATLPTTVSGAKLGDDLPTMTTPGMSDFGLMLAVVSAVAVILAILRNLVSTSQARRSVDRWLVAPLTALAGLATFFDPLWSTRAWIRLHSSGWAEVVVSAQIVLAIVFMLVWRERQSALLQRALSL